MNEELEIKEDEIPMVSQPPNLHISLFKHQLATIWRMEKLEHEKSIKVADSVNLFVDTKIGINSNRTGFGKSLEMIGLTVRNKMEWPLEMPYEVNTMTQYSNMTYIRHTRYYYRLPTTLIIAGQSIISQWLDELSKSVLKYTKVTTQKSAMNINPREYDVIVVSPTMYNRLVRRFNDHAWKRFIYDEPGNVKVPSMRDIMAGFYWFVTATPYSIMLNVRYARGSFLKDIFRNLYWDDHVFRSIIIKQSDEFVKRSFEMPDTIYKTHYCHEKVYKRVRGFVPDNILEMISANNIQGAIQALGGKQTDNIIELIRTKKMKELAVAEAKVNYYDNGDEDRKKKWEENRDRLITQLAELDQRFNDELGGDCSICKDVINNPVLEPLCQHIFCAQCLLTWLKNTMRCPMCRGEVSLENLVYISDKLSEKGTENEEKTRTKLETIIDIVSKREDGRFIIFSAFDETFPNIRSILDANKIGYAEVKGRHESRDNNLKKFREGLIKVIFLNANYNGAGINLQETTDIILYHDMSEGMKTQVIGRANRIGRTVPLTVHELKIF